jgi:hypothetical protein
MKTKVVLCSRQLSAMIVAAMATLLHQLGIDDQRFTFRHQGLDARLTGVEPAKVVKALIA